MTDDLENPPRGYNTEDVREVPEPKRRRARHRGKLILLGVILVPVLLLTLWTAITLAYTYSSGERVGYIQKFSRKGWLCKTWEGELALATVPGVMPEKFEFSVRDDAVARKIQQMQGQRVALRYEQKKGIPTSCFGETQYFATDVTPAAP